MEAFTPWRSLGGGVLIGLAASFLLSTNGRVAGISGIVGGLLEPRRDDVAWRLLFVAGLVCGGGMLWLVDPALVRMTLDRSPQALVAAGLLVGFGTRLGSGCTSGHGVCGVSRGAQRSIVATATFMVAGVLTAVVVHLLGGRL